MSPLPPRLADPAAGLAQEAAACTALLEALGREQGALVAADVDALRSATVAKAAQVEALQQLARARTQALRAAGLPADASGMAHWLAQRGTPAAQAAWDDLARLAAQAHRQNARNGRLIGTQRQHWERSLNALMRAAGTAATYGIDGRPQGPSGRRVVVAV